jgi:hypothetical protein
MNTVGVGQHTYLLWFTKRLKRYWSIGPSKRMRIDPLEKFFVNGLEAKYPGTRLAQDRLSQK